MSENTSQLKLYLTYSASVPEINYSFKVNKNILDLYKNDIKS